MGKLKVASEYDVYQEYFKRCILDLPEMEYWLVESELTKSLGKTSYCMTVLEHHSVSKMKNQEQKQNLDMFSCQIELQKFYIDLMKEKAWINLVRYEVLEGLIIKILRMIGGLYRYYGKS